MNPNADDGIPQIPDYEIIKEIGKGSYGKVWLGRNAVGSLRAIKVVERRKFPDDHSFYREFEGLSKFEPICRTHQGFVSILHVVERFAKGNFYYVMELADDARTGRFIEPATYVARTLARELPPPPQRLSLETSLPIGLSLASALAKLHEYKFIHRDIKPSNIIFVKGMPTFADIGLITNAGQDVSAFGTLNYMPPEGPGDKTGDIFSLGKVFYQLFMGQPVEKFPEVPGAAEEFPTNPALQQLNQIILKACDPNPGRRFQTANELREALVSVTETVQGKRPGTGAGAASIGTGTTTPRGEERTKARWTRRAVLLLLLLLLAIGGAVFLATTRPNGTAGVKRLETNSPPAQTRSPLFIPAATNPVIVLMDTTSPKGIYDSNNVNTGRSNADELYPRLAGLDGVVLQKNMDREGIGLEWARDTVVAARRPDIVIIHRSSFFHPFAAELNLEYPPFVDDADGEKLRKWQALYDSQDARLRSLIRAVGATSPHTQFLIYSTGTDQRWLKPEFRSNWVNSLEVELPDLEGSINTMVIEPQPNGEKGTFRDPATMEKVRAQVREMIRKLEKRKTEKTN